MPHHPCHTTRRAPPLPLVAFCATLFSGGAVAAGLDTPAQQFSYTVGTQMARSLQQQGVEVEPAAFSQGVLDAINGKKLALTGEQMNKSLQDYREEQQKKRIDAALENGAAGKQYAAAFSKKKGVVKTKSGLMYRVIKAGDGPIPKASDRVTVHYRGTLIDGTEFDSSYSRNEPTTFPVHGVVPGWQEALQLMPVGSKWEVVLPPELAYGSRGAGSKIGPDSTLVFQIELLGIEPAPKAGAKAAP